MAALAFSGLGALVVGVEPDPLGARVYIATRGGGRYFLVTHPEDVERAHHAWAGSYCGHLVMDRREVPYLLTEYRAASPKNREDHDG